jgi:two-component sensor histidine kinase
VQSVEPGVLGQIQAAIPDGVADPGDALRLRIARLERSLKRSETYAVSLLRELAACRRKIGETKLLVREVDHRAKNSLQLAASMLQMQARIANDPEVRDQLASAMGRLRSLAHIHAALHETDAADDAPVKAWLERICYAFEITGDIALRVEAPDISWPVPLVRNLGLLAGEAVANALKHAFAGGRAGRLSVRLTEEGVACWRLQIADDGDGRPDAIVEGLGLRLLRIFAGEIGGELRLEPGLDGRGLAVSVVFDGPQLQTHSLL